MLRRAERITLAILCHRELSSEKAPAGYIDEFVTVNTATELDSALTKIITNLNSFKQYRCIFGIFGIYAGIPSDYWLFEITRVGDVNAAITAKSIVNNENLIVHRAYISYQLSEWEWLNPPMALGVEYRTTERHTNKVVYCMAVYCGYLPDSTYKTTEIGTTIARCIRYNLVNRYSSEMLTGHRHITVAVNNSLVQITTHTDMSSYEAVCILWYTKD